MCVKIMGGGDFMICLIVKVVRIVEKGVLLEWSKFECRVEWIVVSKLVVDKIVVVGGSVEVG